MPQCQSGVWNADDKHFEQLQPNPDNPRQGRNPRYEEIKSSIRARGLDSVPKVTKAPGSEFYIFSDGGNTRYQILSELRQETQDERFFRLHSYLKPAGAFAVFD